MSTATFYIKEGKHFKLWLQLKDKIAFEAKLVKNEIPFHIDDNQSTLGSEVRYFFLDEYRVQVDETIKSTGIIASTDTIAMNDIQDSKKVQKLYFVAVLIVVLLLAITILCFG